MGLSARWGWVGGGINHSGSFATNEIRRKNDMGRKESLVTGICILKRVWSTRTLVSSENEAGCVEFRCFTTRSDEVKLREISK